MPAFMTTQAPKVYAERRQAPLHDFYRFSHTSEEAIYQEASWAKKAKNVVGPSFPLFSPI